MEPDYVSHLLRTYPELTSTLQGPQIDLLAHVIRSERAVLSDNHFGPFDFLGLDNSGDGFMGAYFNWRWFNRGSQKFRCVTVEFGQDRRVTSYGPPRIRPRDLFSNDSDYHTELGNAFFNWRWFNRSDEQFKLVTVETAGPVEGVSFPIGNSVRPRHLKGLPGDQQNWGDLAFNWRWFERKEGERFRVLTVE